MYNLFIKGAHWTYNLKCLKNLPYWLKCRRKRLKCGYDDNDLWNIDIWFVKTLRLMLQEYNECQVDAPVFDMNATTEENMAQRKSIVNEMITCLDNMLEYDLNLIDRLETDFEGDYEKLAAHQKAVKNRFFELFSKYFYYSWD